MAGRKDPFLNLDNDKLMELLSIYSADSLRAEQGKLTAVGNQLDRLAKSRLSGLFAQDELQALQRSIELVRSVGRRVEHAKEVKKRREEEAARIRADKERAMNKALDAALPNGFEDPQQCIDLVITTLAFQSYQVVYERKTVAGFERMLKEDVERQVAGGHSLVGVFNALRREVLMQLHDDFTWRQWEIAQEFVQETFAKLTQRKEAVAQSSASFLEYLRAQLQIEGAENVQRLMPGSKKRDKA